MHRPPETPPQSLEQSKHPHLHCNKIQVTPIGNQASGDLVSGVHLA